MRAVYRNGVKWLKRLPLTQCGWRFLHIAFIGITERYLTGLVRPLTGRSNLTHMRGQLT